MLSPFPFIPPQLLCRLSPVAVSAPDFTLGGFVLNVFQTVVTPNQNRYCLPLISLMVKNPAQEGTDL
jgi:hypothetical protein